MKRTLSLIAIASVAAMAAPVKFGADALAGYNIVSVGSDIEGMESAPSFGIAVGPTAAYVINDQFSIGAGVSFLWNMDGVKAKEGDGEMTAKTMSLGLQIAPSYKINDKISVKAGYEWDMPIGGTATMKVGDESEDADIVWAPSSTKDLKEKEAAVMSIHNIVLGGSYGINEKLAVTLQGKFALNGSSPEYDMENGDLKGAAKSSENITVHQIALGVSYGF